MEIRNVKFVILFVLGGKVKIGDFNCYGKINKGLKEVVKGLLNVFNEKFLILKGILKILKILLIWLKCF